MGLKFMELGWDGEMFILVGVGMGLMSTTVSLFNDSLWWEGSVHSM